MVLTNRRNLSSKRQKSARGKSFSCRFSFSAVKNDFTKATEYVTFGFSFRSLVFFLFKESLNITVLKLRGFFSALAAIIQKHCDKLAMNYSFFRTYATTSPVVESDAVRCMDQTDIHVNALQESLKKVTLLSIKFIVFHIMILQIITLIIIIIIIIIMTLIIILSIIIVI